MGNAASEGESRGCDGKGKRIAIVTFGCQMNTRDSEVVAGLLKNAGYALVSAPEAADIVIFNTCSVRQHAEDKVWSEIGRIAKLRDSPLRKNYQKASAGTVPIVGIVGCMAQNYKDGVFKRAPNVDFAAGPSDIDKIPKIIKSLEKIGTVPKKRGQSLFLRKIWETEGETRPEEIYHTGFYEDKEHAYVVISEGCSNFCSYCVVPYVRGAIRHRDPADILKEIEEAVSKGITNITLLGQNVNAYCNFIELLKMVNDIKGVKEFSFITSHPKDTSVELFKAMAQLDKLKKYLHLPVQSGSDKILKLMNRGYAGKSYLELAKQYRKIVKGGALTTDIIVGFPQESEEDFKDTYNLVRDIEFNAAYIFKYSPRPNTRAQKLVDDVPKEEKERRHRLILELQRKISNKVKSKK